jgi:hypothetical protein
MKNSKLSVALSIIALLMAGTAIYLFATPVSFTEDGLVTFTYPRPLRPVHLYRFPNIAHAVNLEIPYGGGVTASFATNPVPYWTSQQELLEEYSSTTVRRTTEVVIDGVPGIRSEPLCPAIHDDGTAPALLYEIGVGDRIYAWQIADVCAHPESKALLEKIMSSVRFDSQKETGT